MLSRFGPTWGLGLALGAGAQYLVPGTWYLEPGAWYWVPWLGTSLDNMVYVDINHVIEVWAHLGPGSDPWCWGRVPGTWYLGSGAWYWVPWLGTSLDDMVYVDINHVI
jgi:hypothetical protein